MHPVKNTKDSARYLNLFSRICRMIPAKKEGRTSNTPAYYRYMLPRAFLAFLMKISVYMVHIDLDLIRHHGNKFRICGLALVLIDRIAKYFV